MKMLDAIRKSLALLFGGLQEVAGGDIDLRGM